MSPAEFTAFYHKFDGFTPAVVMTEYIRQANARFSGFVPEDAEEARRLYTAHRLTMYARTALPETDGAGAHYTYAQLAAAGQNQRVSSKKAGEVAVTYSSGTSSAISVKTGLADLTETDFGLQLLSLLKMYARPVYVP